MLVNIIARIIVINLVVGNIMKAVHSDSTSVPGDFSKVVKSKVFFDKSMLIREILTYKLIHITCPKRFGKSTNMDMIKRFLEINVDEKGVPTKFPRKTENYKLFMDKNLKIFQRVHLFKTHFGKYPVLFMDYSDFREIHNLTSVVSIYKTIIQRTFFQHKYLLENQTLWTNNASKELFHKYRDGKVILSTEDDIRNAFEFLLKIIFQHFNKQVYILIDNYDAHVELFIFKEVPDMDRILTFIHTINEHLLNDNDKLIYGAVVTGVLRLSTVLPTLLRTEVQHFPFFLDHAFADFYGITEDELDGLLIKLIPDSTKRNQTKQTIDEFYKGYKVATQNTKLYNVYSIVNFLHHGKQTSCWCDRDSFESFKSVFGQELVREKIETLLSGNKVWASVSNPFFNEDVVSLNSAVFNKNDEIDSETVDLLFVLLYHLGYLSVTDDVTVYSIALKIPNREIFDELELSMQDIMETEKSLQVWNKLLSNLTNEVGES